MTGLRLPDTIYDAGMHPWQQNINDLVDYKRMFQEEDGGKKRIAQAMISQNPLTPNWEIRQNMTTRKFPPRFGYNDQQLTVRDILHDRLQQDAEINTDEWNNFSGSQGEINSTNRPNGMWW
jgi:hypothetical protein